MIILHPHKAATFHEIRPVPYLFLPVRLDCLCYPHFELVTGIRFLFDFTANRQITYRGTTGVQPGYHRGGGWIRFIKPRCTEVHDRPRSLIFYYFQKTEGASRVGKS